MFIIVSLINFTTLNCTMMEIMKYSFNWIIFITLSIVVIGCQRSSEAGADEIVINGKLTNATGKMIWLSEYDTHTMHVIDSVRVENDELFNFRIKVQEAGFYMISTRNNDFAILIGNKGETIKLTGDATNLSFTWQAKGSEETQPYLEYWKNTRQQLKRVDSLIFIFRSSHLIPEFMATRIKLDSIFNSIMERQREAATHFVNKNPGSLGSLLVIDAKFSKIPLFNEVRDINYFKLVDSSLIKHYPGNKLAIDFHKRVQQIAKRIKNHPNNNRVLPPGELNPSYSPNH